MSDSIIGNSATIEFKASEEVNLESGFEVKTNSQFVAEIEECVDGNN